MKKRLTLFFFATAFLVSAVAPLQTNAAVFSGHIVPDACHCDNQTIQGGTGTVNTAPDWGCVLATIQNIINFAVLLSSILVGIYLAITGVAFITSAGSSEARSKAKTRFTNVFVGLAVLLCAWLLVDFVMKTLYDQGKFGPWNSILAGTGSDQCIKAKNPISITAGQITSQLQGISSSTGTSAGFNASAGANARICSAANAYQGASTVAGPERGNKACAWAVNNVLRNAGYSAIGGDAVSGMESALRGGRGTLVSQAQATCGDIVIEAGDSHVGICMNDGCSSVISNSSSNATFTWISSIDFRPSYSSGNGRIYHVNN